MSATDDNRTAKQRKGTAAKLANIVLGVGQFGYATDTKVTKVGDGVTTFALLPSIGGGGGAAYLKYVALLSQTGTDDPVASVLENTLGNIVWTRGNPGEYFGTLNGAFSNGSKVLTNCSQSANNDTGFAWIYRYDLNSITIETKDTSIVSSDDILSFTMVEIRVYP